MKTIVLFGVTLLAAASAYAQTNAPASADPANKTVTLTGCVGGGSDSAPITLSQAMVIPTTAQPDQASSPVPSSASPAVTQPDATVPPPSAAAVTPAPTDTSGTSTPAPGTAGTTGVMTGTAPAGSSGSSITGYRLSGADMRPWLGKRVQLRGTFAPASAAPAGSTTASAVTGGASAPPALEFRVQAVQPVTGPCSKP